MGTLAKFSGIIIAHPGLKLSIEGYTDSTGSDSFNQKLSEDRADSVRDYLIQQGISPESITAQGLGKSSPVASKSFRDAAEAGAYHEVRKASS